MASPKRLEVSDGLLAFSKDSIAQLASQRGTCEPTVFDWKTTDTLCLPKSMATGLIGTFADPQCKDEPIAAESASSCDPKSPPALVTTPLSNECDGARRALFETGSQVVGPLYASADGKTCSEFPSAQGVFRYGNSVDLGNEPRLTRVQLGTGRVHASYAAVDGLPVVGGDFVDDQGRPCRPRKYADGVVRCVRPVMMPAMNVYSDPACTQSVYLDPTPVRCGAWKLDLVEPATGACGPLHAYQAEPTGSRQLYARNDAGACFPIDPESFTFVPAKEVKGDDLGPPIQLFVE